MHIRAAFPRLAATDQGTQRVGPLVVIPDLLKELGADPAEVLSNAGLDVDGLTGAEYRISYLAMAKLLQHCTVRTGYPHFGLLAGQRMSLSHLGLPGELLRYSATLGMALRTFAVYHHLNSHGHVMFMTKEDGMVAFGAAI